MNCYIGIDPGASGGIAAIGNDGVARVWKMPETDRDILDMLVDLGSRDGSHAWIERVGPMPKQGIASTAKFMAHNGALKMALVAAEVPFDLVTPGVWQRAMGCLSRGDKNVTKRRAQELYPHLKITHALADALLIATYGYRIAGRGAVGKARR